MSTSHLAAYALSTLSSILFAELVMRRLCELAPPDRFRRATLLVVLQLTGVSGVWVCVAQLFGPPSLLATLAWSFAQLVVVVRFVYRLPVGAALGATAPLYFAMAALGWFIDRTGLVGASAALFVLVLPAVRDVRFERRMQAGLEAEVSVRAAYLR